MSLNNIELNGPLVAELYKDTLLSSPDSSSATYTPPPAKRVAPMQPAPSTTAVAALATGPAAPEPSAPYKFLGNNRRRTAILVSSPDTAFLPDDQLAFLTKILEACQMNIGDVAIVNHARTPVVVSALRQQLHPSVILLFGIDPVAIKLPIRFPVFKVQSYDDCTYLCTPAMEELVANTHEGRLQKSKLWISLKTIFNV